MSDDERSLAWSLLISNRSYYLCLKGFHSHPEGPMCSELQGTSGIAIRQLSLNRTGQQQYKNPEYQAEREKWGACQRPSKSLQGGAGALPPLSLCFNSPHKPVCAHPM